MGMSQLSECKSFCHIMQMILGKKIIFPLKFKVKDGDHLQNINSEGYLTVSCPEASLFIKFYNSLLL